MSMAATLTSAAPIVRPATSSEKGMKLIAEKRVAAMMGTQMMWIHLFLSEGGGTRRWSGSCRKR
jgi:hypothetical protein